MICSKLKYLSRQGSDRLGRSGKALRPARGSPLWLTKENHIRTETHDSRATLERNSAASWDKAEHQYSLSSTDGWTKRTNESILKAVPTNSLRTGSTHVGRMAPSCPICYETLAIQHNQETPYELILGYTPNVHQPNRATSVPGITERPQANKRTSPSSTTCA